MNVRRSQQPDMPYVKTPMLEGKLLGILQAPESITSEPTHAMMKVYRRSGSGFLHETDKTIQITNNDPSFTAEVDVYVRVVQLNKSWVVDWIGCEV